MVFVDAYAGLNMWSGFNFYKLNSYASYDYNSSMFRLNYYDGTSETFTGSGFTYDYYGRPTGTGFVTGYHADAYGYQYLSVAGGQFPSARSWPLDLRRRGQTTWP